MNLRKHNLLKLHLTQYGFRLYRMLDVMLVAFKIYFALKCTGFLIQHVGDIKAALHNKRSHNKTDMIGRVSSGQTFSGMTMMEEERWSEWTLQRGGIQTITWNQGLVLQVMRSRRNREAWQREYNVARHIYLVTFLQVRYPTRALKTE